MYMCYIKGSHLYNDRLFHNQPLTWSACFSFLQRVFYLKPSSCYPPPLRRKGRVEAKVEQQMKRSPKQSLSLLAFTCISSGMSLIPIKRWFSLNLCCTHFSLTSSHSASARRRAEVMWRWIPASVSEVWSCSSASDGDSLLKCNDCWMLNTCETSLFKIFFYVRNPVCCITRFEGSSVLIHLSSNKSVSLFLL